MSRIEKTVFISYRRTNASWALAIFQNLTSNGYDVFFDYSGIASGRFESVILSNIKARAHFLVLLTPSALKRSEDPKNWFRREIETALETKRNIVPLMLEGFDFNTPAIARRLTGKLAGLKEYNALNVYADYFAEAMDRLRQKYLNVELDAVLHPPSRAALKAAEGQKAAADTAPSVLEQELTAQQWFERGFEAKDLNDQIRFYTQAIRLKPDDPDTFINRGIARGDNGDLTGAIEDLTEAIRLKPDDPDAFYNRGIVRADQGNLADAIEDYNQAISLDSTYADAFNNRGVARKLQGELTGALKDYTEAIRLKPDYVGAFNNRANISRDQGDIMGALKDYTKIIHLRPDSTYPFYNRALLFDDQGNYEAAIADLQRYLDNGGGVQDGDQREVEQMIRDFRKKSKTTQIKTRGAKSTPSRTNNRAKVT